MKEIAKWKNESLSSKSGSKIMMSGFDDSFNVSSPINTKLQGKKDEFSNSNEIKMKSDHRGGMFFCFL
jgi:hypothetical protein